MAYKFKIGDAVFFKDKDYDPCQEYPRKGTSHEAIGKIIDADDWTRVRWTSGYESSYHDYQLRHKHRIMKFFRYLYDIVHDTIKDHLQGIKKEASTYRIYRRFKKGDIVCLKESNSIVSACELGKIMRKKYPILLIAWNNRGTDYSRQHVQNIEYYTGMNPNRLFKRNMT